MNPLKLGTKVLLNLNNKMNHIAIKGAIFLLLSVITLSSCSGEPSPTKMSGYTMGTTFSIIFYKPEVDNAKLKAKIGKLFNDFDQAMSNWNKKSWVVAFNNAKKGVKHDVPEEALRVLELCLDLNEKSEGYFDITISPLLDVWGFGSKKQHRIPTKEEIESISQLMGRDKIVFSKTEKSIYKTVDGLEINCSAVAKGYGVDLVVALLQKHGIKYYMVEIGGEVRATTKKNGEAWNIGIPIPKKGGGDKLQRVIDLKNNAMATSGDYNNFFTIEGKTYPHIINPKTGFPVEHNLCSVSIIAPSCALADGLATACLVLGKEKGMILLEKFKDCKGYFIERDEKGQFKSSFSKSFK